VLRPGHHVLDVGCGSGILSIAAAKLGAERVCGVDIDPVAVRVAGQNAADNGLDLEFKVGDLSSGVTGRYHVVLANIVADIILRLLPDLKRVMLPGGAFVASGIIDTREDELTAAVAATGYRINRRLSQNGWVALLIGEAD
jgi:ribosomal protein L11 methyltransferase